MSEKEFFFKFTLGMTVILSVKFKTLKKKVIIAVSCVEVRVVDVCDLIQFSIIQ